MSNQPLARSSDQLPPRTEVLDGILDRVHPPVPRFRVISNGLAVNHTIKADDDISGTRACLSCGNCVDACPVVASKPEGTMFVRTSMLLENVVASECRRCYKCIAACPQVTLTLKQYARGFRRVERLAHWVLLISYLLLMSTGILINHWGTGLPEDLRGIFAVLHRIVSFGLVAAPLIYFLFDRRHFMMTARKVFSWSGADLAWFWNIWRWSRSGGAEGELNRGAFNPAQRLWYLYVPLVVLVFAGSGVVKWLGPGVLGQGVVNAATTVHVFFAWATDILVALHVWLKLVWPALRDMARGYRHHFEVLRRKRATVLVRVR